MDILIFSYNRESNVKIDYETISFGKKEYNFKILKSFFFISKKKSFSISYSFVVQSKISSRM